MMMGVEMSGVDGQGSGDGDGGEGSSMAQSLIASQPASQPSLCNFTTT